MTREQFQNQFKTQVTFDEDTFVNILKFEEIRFETPIFRALERLIIIKDDGKYYMR